MKLLVTAGPTREAIDPVRFVSNRSSGKMGFALAVAAARRGHEVTLVAGPVALRTPPGVRRVDVVTTADLLEAVLRELPACDTLVMAAAPADWRPVAPAGQKLKKRNGPPRIRWEATPDVLLAAARARRSGQLVVGFAAETRDIEQEALRKLRKKRLDAVIANDVSKPDRGMGADTNAVTIYTPTAPPLALPLLPKPRLATRLVRWLESFAAARLSPSLP